MGAPNKIPIVENELTLYRDVFPGNQLDDFFNCLKEKIFWKQEYITIAQKIIAQPRLTAWHGDPSTKYIYSNLTLQPKAWNQDLLLIKEKVEDISGFHFNGVLLNYYRDGNDSVAWHSDNEAQLGDQPGIASFSLGETRKFVIKKAKKPDSCLEIFLRTGDLLIMYGEFQQNWIHALPKSKLIKNPRINLTFRKIKS